MRSVSVSVLAVLVLSGLLQAQSQTPAASVQAAGRLPVRRVVLYKSGVGYFEHLGRVRGNQTVAIDFTSGQLDDVLKSLTALDLDGGRVSGVSYNSEAGLDRRLAGLRLPVGSDTTRAQFLNALRGARLEVRDGVSRVTGRLLSVEQTAQKRADATTSIDTLSIVTEGGELQTIALGPGVSVRILEADLTDEVAKYLSLVASVREQDVRRLTLSTSGTGDRDLFVSYVSEVPVWKATYRLVLPDAKDTRKPLLQGWAIVDNTVGEDWVNVQLSLVAGAPQSFVQSLSQPYYVQRPVVPLPERVLTSPQTHQSAMSYAGSGSLSGAVTDQTGGVIPGVAVKASRDGRDVGSAVTDRAGKYRLTGLSPAQYAVNFTLAGFRPSGYTRVDVGSGMDTVLNTVMTVGSMSESVSVTTGSNLRGSTVNGLPQSAMNITIDGVLNSATRRSSDGFFAGGAPRMDATEEVSVARAAQQVDAAAAQLGDLFEYKLKEPVTIRKNQSAMVPILNSEVQAEKVSLWNATGGGTRALRAVWLTNSSGNTLDGGSFSIVEGQAFAGEGLMDPIKAGEKRLLSYAIDLGLIIDSKGEPIPARTTTIRVSRGLLIQQTEERRRQSYSVRNEDTEVRTLVIEHPVRQGWTLGGTVKPVESTTSVHRFRVTVDPRTTAQIVVEEARPIETQIAIASVTDTQVDLFVRDKMISPALEAQLREVQKRKAGIAALQSQITLAETEVAAITRDQERVRENMRSLKGSSEEKQLLQRYVKQLSDQETRLEALRQEMSALIGQRQKAQADLAAFIEEIK
jgi:hypothetical protein